MNRTDFLKNSAIIGGASILPAESLLAQNVQNNGIDKLTDASGQFVLQPLPYMELDKPF